MRERWADAADAAFGRHTALLRAGARLVSVILSILVLRGLFSSVSFWSTSIRAILSSISFWSRLSFVSSGSSRSTSLWSNASFRSMSTRAILGLIGALSPMCARRCAILHVLCLLVGVAASPTIAHAEDTSNVHMPLEGTVRVPDRTHEAREMDETRRHHARAAEILQRAELADDGMDFARAAQLYEEGLRLDPASGRAPRAIARLRMLQDHAEGDFRPLVTLERVRRDPALASSPAAIAELIDQTEKFPGGRVRVEAWVLAAEAYLERFGDPRLGEQLLGRVLADQHADPVLVRKAARDLVTLHIARGDLASAEMAARTAEVHGDITLSSEVRRAVRRRYMHYTSISLLVLLVALSGRACLFAAKRDGRARARAALARSWKIMLAYAIYVAGAGALLASRYEAGTSAPFIAFGVVLVPLLVVSRAWGATGGTRRIASAGRALVSAAAVLGGAFLVLEHIDVAFLEAMGL